MACNGRTPIPLFNEAGSWNSPAVDDSEERMVSFVHATGPPFQLMSCPPLTPPVIQAMAGREFDAQLQSTVGAGSKEP